MQSDRAARCTPQTQAAAEQAYAAQASAGLGADSTSVGTARMPPSLLCNYRMSRCGARRCWRCCCACASAALPRGHSELRTPQRHRRRTGHSAALFSPSSLFPVCRAFSPPPSLPVAVFPWAADQPQAQHGALPFAQTAAAADTEKRENGATFIASPHAPPCPTLVPLSSLCPCSSAPLGCDAASNQRADGETRREQSSTLGKQERKGGSMEQEQKHGVFRRCLVLAR
jgi:hypothetical protein